MLGLNSPPGLRGTGADFDAFWGLTMNCDRRKLRHSQIVGVSLILAIGLSSGAAAQSYPSATFQPKVSPYKPAPSPSSEAPKPAPSADYKPVPAPAPVQAQPAPAPVQSAQPDPASQPLRHADPLRPALAPQQAAPVPAPVPASQAQAQAAPPPAPAPAPVPRKAQVTQTSAQTAASCMNDGKSAQPDTAIQNCEAIINETSKNLANAYYFRGIAKADKNDLDGAIGDYSQALRLDASDADYLNSRAQAYEAKNDLD